MRSLSRVLSATGLAAALCGGGVALGASPAAAQIHGRFAGNGFHGSFHSGSAWHRGSGWHRGTAWRGDRHGRTAWRGRYWHGGWGHGYWRGGRWYPGLSVGFYGYPYAYGYPYGYYSYYGGACDPYSDDYDPYYCD